MCCAPIVVLCHNRCAFAEGFNCLFFLVQVDGKQGIPAGSGAMVEFRIPEAGTYGLVDHDKLGYVPLGLIQQFDAGPSQSHGTT